MRYPTTLLLLAALLTASCATAQDYSFSVPEMLLEITPNADASVTMEYDVVFTCSQGALPIDIVDMGLPESNYDIGNMTAFVMTSAGQTIECTDIRRSEFVDVGVEVHLGPGTIQPGDTGRFMFRCTMPNRVYQDTTDKEYAHLQMTPTWWGAEYVQGTTKLGIAVYFPKDIKPDELRDKEQPYSRKAVDETRTIAAWLLPTARVDGPHMVGISFPKRMMDRVVKMSVFGLFMKWWTEAEDLRVVIGIILLILFGIMFFRASQGTGISCFIGLLVLFGFLWINSPLLQLLAIPALPVAWHYSEKTLKRRRGKYLPAIASVEGGGVKRGLGAPEAAVLLEQPLNRVLTLVLFGLLKKGICRQIGDDPLVMGVNRGYDSDSRSERRKAARDNGTVIRGYEQEYINALLDAGEVPVSKIDFSKAMKELIKSTAKRVAKFDVPKTKSYYAYIVNKAWTEAKGIGDVEERTRYTDDNLLWLMVADDYTGNFHSWHHHGYHYHAPWIRSAPIGGGGAPAAPTGGGRTTFGDVASSFAGYSENVAGGLVSKVDPAALGISRQGVVDLSGVDKVTIDVLQGMAEGGGGGGGGGCACAGCACACACAGGGR